MVVMDGKMILIKIATPNAGEIFNKMQHSIIDVVQHTLWANSDSDTVTLDGKTAKSLCVQLETLRESLIDARDVQAAMELATQIMPPPNPPEG